MLEGEFMLNLIRSIAILSFIIFLSIFLSACGISSAQSEFEKPRQQVQIPDTVSRKPKIIAFGDSLTAGFGLSEKESYPYLLQGKLRAGGFDYEVVNAGISGDTSSGGLERIDWSLDQENVQVLILELGGNDLLRGLPVEKMKANLSTIIKKAKARNVKVLLCGMLAPPTMGARYQREFVAVFPDLAAEHKVEFLPFILENVAADPKLNQPDGIHPNAEGARIMTDNVYKALQPLLKK
jgi:acyl-CoA thioesterase I